MTTRAVGGRHASTLLEINFDATRSEKFSTSFLQRHCVTDNSQSSRRDGLFRRVGSISALNPFVNFVSLPVAVNRSPSNHLDKSSMFWPASESWLVFPRMFGRETVPDPEKNMSFASVSAQQSTPPVRGKVVIIGEYNCGKSALVRRFVNGDFSPIGEPTIAAAFQTKTVELWKRSKTASPSHHTRASPPATNSFAAASTADGSVKANSAETDGTVIASASPSPPRQGLQPTGSSSPPAVVVASAVPPPAASGGLRRRASSMLSSLSRDTTTSTENASWGGRQVKLDLWDTAGSERYQSLMPMYFRDAAAAIVAYDITVPSSLVKVTRWVSLFREHAKPPGYGVVGSSLPPPEPLYVAIVATKEDLRASPSTASSRTATPRGTSATTTTCISRSEGASLAEGLPHCEHFVTSSRTGLGVDEVFYRVAEEIVKQDEDMLRRSCHDATKASGKAVAFGGSGGARSAIATGKTRSSGPACCQK